MSESFVGLDGIRRRAASNRRRYWKSLEELAESPAFLEFLHREFPENASEWSDAKGRRDFLRLMGASMALAGLTACTRQPEEKIVPYVRAPEELVPGKPLFFASAVTDRGYARGVLVESHLGRPTKIEGNPEHPASLGATDVFGQAEVLELYDPDRSQTVKYRGDIRSWSNFVAALRTAAEAQRALGGEGLRILTGAVTSPTLAAQLEETLAAFPKAKWHQWEPAGRDNARAGALLAFGEPVGVRYDLAQADVVLSLESDFMTDDPASLRLIREFAARRRAPAGAQARAGHAAEGRGMNRLYVVEGSPSVTGSSADHRLPLRSSEIEGFARAVAGGLGLAVDGGRTHAWVAPLAKDLLAHPGAAVVVVGESQPPQVHALAHAMNERLGAVGKTVFYTEPVEAKPVDHGGSLQELADDLAAGKVDLLLILGPNPVYDAPVDLSFGERLQQAQIRVHLGLHEDETAELCHWHLPAAHWLETWSDARAHDGTVTIQQPLIAPLYEGHSAHEVLAAISERPERTGYDVVRGYWAGREPGPDFESRWRRALHDGVWPGTAAPEKTVAASLGGWATAPIPAPASGLEALFRLDPSVGDGRHGNNGWLQELPKPLTKLTWENAALVSPRTAEGLGFAAPRLTATGSIVDVAEVRLGEARVFAPVWVVPGHADDAVTLPLGYGRRKLGRVGNGAGFDAYALRASTGRWFAGGLELSPSGRTALVACTQEHWSIEHEQALEERHLVRTAAAEDYARDPHVFHEGVHEPDPKLTLYKPFEYDGHAWGMTIDLSSCVGCNACIVACQSENNIPVVGKEQVGRGREMHWLRVDRYYEGGLETPEAHFQPVPCMQCENAPCEQVCPVTATVHSDEGLNDMVYNRCVGTRYCSNNCPYKVRRFNFFLYTDWETPSLKLQRNPDVTVRSRGVMEKCTYCVQRINHARIEARNAGRPIADGEIQTACQQACPAQAIVFGDINDSNSRVSQLKAEPRNYTMLAELNTRPRTSYLGALKNPNPEIAHG